MSDLSLRPAGQKIPTESKPSARASSPEETATRINSLLQSKQRLLYKQIRDILESYSLIKQAAAKNPKWKSLLEECEKQVLNYDVPLRIIEATLKDMRNTGKPIPLDLAGKWVNKNLAVSKPGESATEQKSREVLKAFVLVVERNSSAPKPESKSTS